MSIYNFKTAKEVVLYTIKGGRTPFIWGPPGIGKSALGREVANLLDANLYILDVPLLQPTDFCLPVPNHDEKKVYLYPSGFLPEKGPAVVLVEDLPHAKSYQQVPVMQMVLDRRIGALHFSDDVYFIITGNREEDLAGVNPVPSPLLNRVVHIDMDPDIDEWIEWGKINDIDSDILGFIRAYPDRLLETPKEGNKAWPTPRSWHMLSDILKVVKKENKLNKMTQIVASSIGEATANLFSAWVKYLKEVNPEEIIKTGILPQTDRVKLFAITQSVTAFLTKKPSFIDKYAENIQRIFSSLEGEFKVLFLKELIVYKNNKPDNSILLSLLEKNPIYSQYISQLVNSLT